MSDRTAALEKRLIKLRNEVQRREDYLAIIRLQRAYGFYIDKGYWREATNLFCEDATYEQGVDGVYVGRARIHAMIVRLTGGNVGPGLPFGQLHERFQLQPIITLADNGLNAKGRWHELSMYGNYGKSAEWGDGVYENSYRKEGGVWKIATVRLYMNFIAPYKGGWATLGAREGDWSSPALADFPPDRPSTDNYRPYPHVHVPPFHYTHPVTGKAVTP
jgi:hypothetical protein